MKRRITLYGKMLGSLPEGMAVLTILELAYLLVITLIYFIFDSRVALAVTARGRHLASESQAKLLAMIWRFSEAAVAFVVIALCWLIFLKDTPNLLAYAWTILFGGLYVIMAIVAGVTVPFGNQLLYFQTMYAKVKGTR